MTQQIHVHSGLFFQRVGECVRLLKTVDGLAIAPGHANVVVDITLSREDWESVVNAMAQPCTFRDDGLEARAAWSDAQRRAHFAASHHVPPEG